MVKNIVSVIFFCVFGGALGSGGKEITASTEFHSFHATYKAIKSNAPEAEIEVDYSKNKFLLLALLTDPPIYFAVAFHGNDSLETYIIKGDKGTCQRYDFSWTNSELLRRYQIVDKLLFPERQKLSPTIDLGLTADEINMSVGFMFSSGDLSCSWLDALSEGQIVRSVQGNEIITNGSHKVVIDSKTKLLLSDEYPSTEDPQRAIILSNVVWSCSYQEWKDYIPDFDHITISPCSEKVEKEAMAAFWKKYYLARFRGIDSLPENVENVLKADAREKGAACEVVFEKEHSDFVNNLRRGLTEKFYIELTKENLEKARPLFEEIAPDLAKESPWNVSAYMYEDKKSIPPSINEIDDIWVRYYTIGFMEKMLANGLPEKETAERLQ